jgi:hypothetical protein
MYATAPRRGIWIRACAWLLVVLFNLAFAEMIAGVFFRVTTGSWIWTREASFSPPGDRDANPGGDPVRTKMVLHPYFGSNTVKGLRFDTLWEEGFYKDRITGLDYLPDYYHRLTVNSHGFWSLHEYPYKPAQDELVVGVFGGSVAFHFWLSALDEKSPTLKRIAHATGKRLVVLNFASGGRKQPEMLLQLGYFLAIGQKLDFVLNIDGFNDAYVSWLNVTNYETDHSMPFAEFMYKIQNGFAERVQVAGGAFGWPAILAGGRDTARRLERSTRSALVKYGADYAERFLISRLNAAEVELAEQRTSLRYAVQMPASTRSFEQALPDLASMWFNSSVAMASLAKGVGIPYLHILQPNQYGSQKRLSPKEQEWGVRDATQVPLSAIVPLAYDAFLLAAARFPERSVNFIDATPIYDGAPETIFIDWCCHVNETGNWILNGLIEPRMVEELLPTEARGSR